MSTGYPVKSTQNTDRKILVLFAHPAIHKSRLNRQLIKPLKKLENITFHDLYERYPDFYIDVKKEQKLLTKHDIIVFMHPFYWYSTPAILKEWQDLVLEHGFAYGEQGTALQGKWLVSALTTAGTESSYLTSGSNRYTLKELLTPIEQTAHLCGMYYLPPFVIHNALKLSTAEIEVQAEILKNTLLALRDGKIELSKSKDYKTLNALINNLSQNT